MIKTMQTFRCFGLFLVLAMLVSLFSLFSLPAAAEETVSVWGGADDIAAGFAGGDGTEATPYLISTAAQLAYLASYINGALSTAGQYYKLTTDIDLAENAWTPVGTKACPFSGTFDGDGNSINGLKLQDLSDQGLFTYATGTMQNLSVKTVPSDVANQCAAFVGVQSGALTVNAVNVDVQIAGGGEKIAGIVGFSNKNFSKTFQIFPCAEGLCVLLVIVCKIAF